MPVLEVEGITKRFGSETAVDDLSVTVERGQFKSLLGPSGCGKTTTLRCIAGLEDPDEGQISIEDEVVFNDEDGVNVNPEDRDIGMVFQSYAVWPHMTVKENVAFPLKMQKLGGEEIDRRVDEVLQTVGLAEYKDNLATHLSGGQQQRVAISRSLVVEPEILLFDEPLASLDAKLRREMRMEIKRICDEVDITVLYVTHSQDEAMFLSDHIAIMNDGRIVEEGEPKLLHEDPSELFSMQFMGHTNSFESEVTSIDGEFATLDSPIGELRVQNVENGVGPGDRVMTTIRPKFISFVEADSGDGENRFRGRVNYVAPTRDFTEYEIDVDGLILTVKTAIQKPFRPGDDVEIDINSDNLKIWST